jgi:hypothetical protein
MSRGVAEKDTPCSVGRISRRRNPPTAAPEQPSGGLRFANPPYALIPGRMDSAGKRLGKWMFEIGIPGIPDPDITDKDGKAPGELDKAPMHSFRHRAANRLRAAGVSEDVREAVGGWANGKKKKTSRKYGNKHGAGYPLSVLKKAIDKIGF